MRKQANFSDFLKDLAAVGAYWVAKQITDGVLPEALLGAYVVGRLLEADKEVKEEVERFFGKTSSVSTGKLDVDSLVKLSKKVGVGVPALIKFGVDSVYYIEHNGKPFAFTDSYFVSEVASEFFNRLLLKTANYIDSGEDLEVSKEEAEDLIESLLLSESAKDIERNLEVLKDIFEEIERALDKLDLTYTLTAVYYSIGDVSKVEVPAGYKKVFLSDDLCLFVLKTSNEGKVLDDSTLGEVLSLFYSRSVEDFPPLSFLQLNLKTRDKVLRFVLPSVVREEENG